MNYIEQEIYLSVPLDYSQSEGAKIKLFARDLYAPGHEQAELLFFFNGGPGFACVRAWRDTPWLIEALKTYRVVLLDQRGTGHSQMVDLNNLQAFTSPEILAEYLSHFRADNIVRDAEYLRAHIFKRDQISVMGQSFGGFVVLSYLSQAPQSLTRAFITAGIAPLLCNSVDEVYSALFNTVKDRNQRFYQRYPADRAKVQAIVAALTVSPMQIAGEVLSVERFLDLGWYLGEENGLATLHHWLDQAFCEADCTRLSWSFAKNVLQATSFWQTSPLYVLMHEAIYCQGFAGNWAADRVKRSLAEFDASQAVPYFSGEMVRANMLQDYPGLTPFAQAAQLLAQKTDWPLLYDLEVLAANTVPVVALLMTDDFYVNYDLAKQALRGIANVRVWRHKTWQHDALRKHGKSVMRGLQARAAR